MLGAERDRLAESERERLKQARVAGAAFRLVGNRHHRHFLRAQPAGDFFIERGEPGARVDHEQRRVGAFDADFGLLAHPARKRVLVLVFPARGVDDGEFEPRQHRVAHPPVARHPGLVVDQRQLLADQPVEQRRLADVGPADDDDLRFHGRARRWRLGARLASAAAGKPILTLSRQLGRMRGSLPLLLTMLALAWPVAAQADAAGDFDTDAAQRELPPYLQCVPYARERSGVQIYGDARTWWDQAAGRYKRGNRPRPGAVMTFRPYAGMTLGHVAAVAKVIDGRTVLLDHANWSPIDGRRGQIERGVKAVDVSPANDWSQVRVWYDPLQDLGTTAWPVAGFIYNERDNGGELG